MIVSEIYTNKSIVILGLGRSGMALAEALTQSGATVLVWDDNPDVLKNRIDIYKKDTLPVINFYKESNRLKSIDGTQSIEKVSNDIQKVIEKV